MIFMLEEFIKSVENLSGKLPQWNSDDKERRITSAISSLFEEAGEISGLVSKYRTRKHYWKAETKTLENFEEIREKFIDEVGDFLWVLTSSAINAIGNSNPLMVLEDNTEEGYCVNFEVSLFDVIRDISLLQQCLMFSDCVIDQTIKINFNDLILSFKTFLHFLNQEYNITLEDICEYNMNKLGNRYDENGKRTDNK